MGLSRPLPGAAVAALWLTVAASAAEAQSRRAGYAGLVLEAPASIEAAAFGNAPYLLGGGAELIFYAPALIGRADGMAASLQRYGSEGTLATLAGTGSVGLGDFAVGLQYLRYTTEGLPGTPDIQWPAVTAEGPPITEFVASLGHSRELFASVEVGVVAKYLEYQFVSRTERTTLLDVGVAREFGPTMVSLAARNLGSDLELRGRGLRIPTQFVMGVSTEGFEVGELDMFLTSQVARRRDGEIIPAGGVEISYWPVQGYTFRLRAGLQRVVEDRRSPFTFGLAFTGDALTFEYAFQAFDLAGNAHRFGLRFR